MVNGSTMLRAKGLEVAYRDIQVLWGVDLEVNEGEIVSILGSNGAGKSTLILTISGLMHPRRGEVYYYGKMISQLPPNEIVKKGIAQIPEGRKLFSKMTVFENLMMGAYCRSDRKEIEKNLTFVFQLFPLLRERKKQIAGTLSGGEQQMCAIARGLMSSPRLLLIDELSLGLSPLVVASLIEVIEQIRLKGMSILLVEQDVQIALEHSDRAYVLETGRITLSGESQYLLEDPKVKSSYLGI